jgi:hypothetical protein
LLFKQAELLAARGQGADLIVHFDPDAELAWRLYPDPS